MGNQTLLLAALSAAFASPLLAQEAAVPPARPTAFVGVTVLPMTGKERLQDQTVVTDGDRILVVGPRRSVKIPGGAAIIDGKGKTLMPGLVDMHMHLSPAPGKQGDSTQRALAMSLANGITTARVMLGQPSHPGVRAAIEKGEIAAPRIYIAAPAMNGQSVPTVDRARAAVAEAKATSFDLLKLHAINDVAIWQTIQDEAKKLGLPAAGHVTNAIGLQRAMAAGQQVEHLDSVPAELLPAGVSKDFGQILPPEVQAALGQVGDDRYTALARDVAAKKSFHVPTLGAFEQITEMRRPFEEMLIAEQDSNYVAPWIVEQWRSRRQDLAKAGFGPAEDDGMGAVRSKIVAAFHKAGVKMMAGSDTPHPFHVWGFGLLREIEALSAAGLGPMDALKAATVVPRDYLRSLPGQGSAMGWTADFGTVEKGARADLLLLDGDPSKDLKALRSPRAVLAAGRLYDREALRAMLAKASADGKAQPSPQQ